jgi:uncharacterized protein (DUF2141 family)
MLKVTASGAILASALFAGSAPAQALGPDAAACRAGGNGILVSVDGFRARTGNIRVALYGSNPAQFLARGATLRKINVPVSRAGPMQICVAVPQAGRYAVAVRHDVDGDNARGDWSDGGGFSRNPRISMMHLKPSYDSVAISAGRGVTPVRVVLNYRFGFSIRPVNG